MSDFATQWATAKTKFENDTDAKKPVQKGRVLFISYRKSTGIESALETIDKLCATTPLENLAADALKKADEALKELKKKTAAYKGELDKAIATEKKDKANSDTYRPLKILRATLDQIVSRIENDLERGEAGQFATKNAYEGAAVAVYKVLKPIKSGLDSNCKKGIATAQKLLADPTPATFNSAFPGAARDITQQVGNLWKYTLPDELQGRSKENVERDLKTEPRLYMKVLDLQNATASAKDFLKDFVQPSGSTPLDANLWKMANTPTPTLADDADAITVKKAIKNYLLNVKEAQKLVGILGTAGL
jgi:hypothetical protein